MRDKAPNTALSFQETCRTAEGQGNKIRPIRAANLDRDTAVP
jgi:hypothetical protein